MLHYIHICFVKNQLFFSLSHPFSFTNLMNYDANILIRKSSNLGTLTYNLLVTRVDIYDQQKRLIVYAQIHYVAIKSK